MDELAFSIVHFRFCEFVIFCEFLFFVFAVPSFGKRTVVVRDGLLFVDTFVTRSPSM